MQGSLKKFLYSNTLANMSAGELYWSLVDKVWDDISIYDGPEIFLDQFNSAPEASRTLYAAHWCQSEVCNGGLHQFFGNSTGVLAPEAVLAYRTIHMRKLGAVVAKAMQWFGPQYPRERDMRVAGPYAYEMTYPDKWNPFEQLDDQFFDLIKSENGGFEAAADAYAAKNVV